MSEAQSLRHELEKERTERAEAEHEWKLERAALEQQLRRRNAAERPDSSDETRDELIGRAHRAEEENSLLRALLLLKNVEVELNLKAATMPSSSADLEAPQCSAETVVLSGEPRILQGLLGLVEKTKHLRLCCYLIRAEAQCLRQTIDETTQWCSEALADAVIQIRGGDTSSAHRKKKET